MKKRLRRKKTLELCMRACDLRLPRRLRHGLAKMVMHCLPLYRQLLHDFQSHCRRYGINPETRRHTLQIATESDVTWNCKFVDMTVHMTVVDAEPWEPIPPYSA